MTPGSLVVDRDFGVVSLADETLIVTERGQVHSVQLKVVEASATSTWKCACGSLGRAAKWSALKNLSCRNLRPIPI